MVFREAGAPKGKVESENSGPGLEGGVSLVNSGRATELWVYSVRENRANPALRLVTVAEWEVPMNMWKTACGWPFAVNRRLRPATRSTVRKKKCRKCINNRKGRDNVNEVELWRLKVQGVSDALDGL